MSPVPFITFFQRTSFLCRASALLILLGLSGCGSERVHVKFPLYTSAIAPPPEDQLSLYQMPLDGKVSILSAFGKRGSRVHTGLDLRAKRGGGDPVRAARAGRITFAGNMHGYGRMVIVEHEDGYQTRYAHLRSFAVHRGEKVKAGEKMGVVGRSGRASTEHLHFELVDAKGRYKDPKPCLFK